MSSRDRTTIGHEFTRTAQIFEGLKVQALQSNMRHLWYGTPLTGNPCSRWSLASEPLVPTYLCSPSQALATGVHHHTQLVCWFWVRTQAVVVTQQVLYWLSHLLSHLPRSSFGEAFAKSLGPRFVVTAWEEGVIRNQQDWVKEAVELWQQGSSCVRIAVRGVPCWTPHGDPRTWRAENLQFRSLSQQTAHSISEEKLNSPFTGESNIAVFSPLILSFSKRLTSMSRNNN